MGEAEPPSAKPEAGEDPGDRWEKLESCRHGLLISQGPGCLESIADT